MSTAKDVLYRARVDGQAIHQKIAAATAKNEAAIRADLESAAADAKRLGDSLKTAAEGQRADAKQQLNEASSRFVQAAAEAKALGAASDAQIRAANQAMIDKTRVALLNLSHAIASTRSAASKN